MPMPVKIIMDDLDYIAQELISANRHEEALRLRVLEDAANAAGHTSYTWEGIAAAVKSAMGVLASTGEPLSEDVAELVNAALCPPKGAP